MPLKWLRNRRLVFILGMTAAAALLVVAFILGLVSFGKMRQVVTEEFNQQQLVLARNMASLIGQDLDFLRRELRALNQSASVGNDPSGAWEERMRFTMSALQGGELLQIWHIESGGRSARVMDASGGVTLRAEDFSAAPYYRLAVRGNARGRIVTLPWRFPAGSGLSGRQTLLMAIPHVHPSDRGRGLAGGTPGALVFVIDASALATRFTAGTRSGGTGYAWVIDETGTFLAHPMRDFIGKNAFKARHEKDPRLGFEGINVIMRNHMLRGQEGTGEYVSGWHREMGGPVRKLIGYCPIRIDPDTPGLFWSVAVVAPTSEVQGMVRSLFMRQLFMQTAIVLAILAGSLSVIRMERYWASVRKEKERQINLSSRLASLGTLAAGVAHEINNPVAIILGFTDLLLEKARDGTPEHEHLKIIEKQATACKRIVENLGRFARVPEQRAEATDLNDELRRVLAMVRNTLLTEKITCVTDFQDGLPPVCGDPQGLQQVFLNLITNARTAMKEGGTLTLRTRMAGDTVEVDVSDTGHGILKKDLERIFDPFFTTKAPGEGTGLGLSISHGIVEKAGGRILVESRHESRAGAEGPGTTFRLVLPVARDRHTERDES